jgi:hypothetical protein|eukprot:scaffold883_cov225-Chaetoceros_neogracile.AAC.9
MTGSSIPVTTPNSYIAGDILKDKPKIPKGRNASGRNWKLRPQTRSSSLVTKTPQNAKSTTWAKKMKEREQRRSILQREKEMQAEKKLANIEKKERRLENERRRMENEFKVASRSAQRLGKNADVKLKAMNKKQLRQIKKTRMNTKTGTIEYVSAYAK